MKTSEKGEIVTLLTIGAVLFLGAAILISTVFLKNQQTTTSKAAEVWICLANSTDPAPESAKAAFGGNIEAWRREYEKAHNLPDGSCSGGGGGGTAVPTTPAGGGSNCPSGWYCLGECASTDVINTFTAVYGANAKAKWMEEKAKNMGQPGACSGGGGGGGGGSGSIGNSCFSLSTDVFADPAGAGWKFNTHIKVFSPENGGDGHIQLFVNDVSKGWNQSWNKSVNNPFDIVPEYTDPFTLTSGSRTGKYRIKIDECADRGNTLEILCTYSVVNGQPKVEGTGCRCASGNCTSAQPTQPANPTRSPTNVGSLSPTSKPTTEPTTTNSAFFKGTATLNNFKVTKGNIIEAFIFRNKVYIPCGTYTVIEEGKYGPLECKGNVSTDRYAEVIFYINEKPLKEDKPAIWSIGDVEFNIVAAESVTPIQSTTISPSAGAVANTCWAQAQNIGVNRTPVTFDEPANLKAPCGTNEIAYGKGAVKVFRICSSSGNPGDQCLYACFDGAYQRNCDTTTGTRTWDENNQNMIRIMNSSSKDLPIDGLQIIKQSWFSRKPKIIPPEQLLNGQKTLKTGESTYYDFSTDPDLKCATGVSIYTITANLYSDKKVIATAWEYCAYGGVDLLLVIK